MSDAPFPDRSRAWAAIGLFAALIILSYVDRVILSLLVAPLKADMKLSDGQIGLLFGAAFALFFGTLGLPLARLADRGNRKWLIVAGVAMWSASTVAAGWAGNFATLLVLRMGVAVGEAALTPAVLSMIGDLFPPEQRTAAAGTYSAASSFGGYGAYIFGAAIIAAMGAQPHVVLPLIGERSLWQAVFVIVGVPGLVLAAIVALTIAEPRRREHMAIGAGFGFFRSRAALFLGLFLGIGAMMLPTFAFAAWLPTHLTRSFGLSIAASGYAFGITGLAASTAGALGSPLVAQRLMRRGRADGLVLTAMACAALASLFGIAASLQSSYPATVALFGCCVLFMTGCTTLGNVACLIAVPADLRATAASLWILLGTMAGLGLAPSLTVLIADRWFSGGLGPALATVAGLGGILSCALLAATRRRFVRQVEQLGAA